MLCEKCSKSFALKFKNLVSGKARILKLSNGE